MRRTVKALLPLHLQPMSARSPASKSRGSLMWGTERGAAEFRGTHLKARFRVGSINGPKNYTYSPW